MEPVAGSSLSVVKDKQNDLDQSSRKIDSEENGGTPFFTPKERVRLPSMGGAMKKRFLRLRKTGLCISAAIEQAKIPLGPAALPKI
jgi:hypothetical protein